MKRFMKKALAVLVALSMLCMPVFVNAAEENPDEAIDIGANYVHYGRYLTVGTADYELSSLYEYTLFTFYPGDDGRYSFSVDSGVIGIISYNGMWVYFDPSEETVCETSFEWESPSEYSEIWVAVKSEGDSASITVKASDTVVKEVEHITYVNKAELAPFTFAGDTNALLYVNTMDKNVDTAVLGTDGCYHLNDAKGPVLYANLSDSSMSLTAAASYGQLKWVLYDEEGDAVQIIDYNEALNEYAECVDPATPLYPLTEDLIEIFKNSGANNGWYGNDGWIGGSYDDAWMYACYYNELPEIEEDPSTAIAQGDNYIHYGNSISVGVNAETLSVLYDYTVFTFRPDETGIYTITVDGGCAGIASYNAMWVTVTPSESTVTAAGAVWECSGVGQKIWVAVKADSNPASITVEREEAVIKEVEKIVYENKHTPEAFTFTGDVDSLLYVDTLDKIVESAVLGADGYYHLNDADGPVLYANLSDSVMSLTAAASYGQLKWVLYDEEGNAIQIIDYNSAFEEYAACVDSTTTLYPLTDDLITIFKKVGENNKWYGQGGWIGGKYEDAWMFAIYYNEAPQYIFGDIDGNGTVNAIDANIIVRIVAGTYFVEAGSAAALAADINGDGKINAADANLFKRIVAGVA